MKNVVDFPDAVAIEEEAIAWLIRLDADDALSAAERERLRDWLNRSPAHRDRLRALADRWASMNVLTELAVPLDQAIRKDRRQFSLKAATLAAIVVAAVVVGSSVWTGRDATTATNGLYATAIGAQQSQLLSDGSVVLLNTNTQVKIDYNTEYRNVYLLQGEAHFTVAKNPDQPFRVFAGGGRISAVGTAFSVYVKGEAVDVMVTEGSVVLAAMNVVANSLPDGSGFPDAVSASQEAQELGTLRAGQIATIVSVAADNVPRIDALNNLREVPQKDLSRRMSWTNGVLVFSGDPLEDVVKEISRYTTVEISFSDPAVGAIRVGGLFPVGETDTMFNTLETTFGLQVTYLSTDRVLVSAASQ